MISTRSGVLVIDTVVCLTLAKWETVSGRFGGYLRGQGCSPNPADLQHCGDEPAPRGESRGRRAGAHAVLLVDQAGWHLSDTARLPANITIIALPPKWPELNPVENVWQFIRDNWLSNRVFKSYDDLVDHCCQAWNKLVDQPWRIMSIGLRQWAHGF